MLRLEEETKNFDLHSEAKQMVLEDMEKSGMLSKMKAQMKANILKILEKQKQSVRQNLEFDYLTPLHKQSKTKDVILAYHLIKEFMQFFELEYTIPIFENETNIRENIKRETLLSELSLTKDNESKPVLLQMISVYLADVNNRKNNYDNVSQKLDESYGVKSHSYSTDANFKPFEEDKKNETKTLTSLSNPPLAKKQLAPISFTNKSVDLKESNSPLNKGKDAFSLKFNTANITDIYSKDSDSKKKDNTLNTQTNKDIIKDNKDGKYNFNSNEYNTNNKYDDEFNEVILEEIEEKPQRKEIEEIEDSRKSFGASTSNMMSQGYDSSVTTYKMDEFDYVEEIQNSN